MHTDDVAAVVHIAAPGSVPGKADRVVISRSGRGVLGVGAAHRGNVLQVERPATGVRGEVSVIELPGPGRRLCVAVPVGMQFVGRPHGIGPAQQAEEPSARRGDGRALQVVLDHVGRHLLDGEEGPEGGGSVSQQ